MHNWLNLFNKIVYVRSLLGEQQQQQEKKELRYFFPFTSLASWWIYRGKEFELFPQAKVVQRKRQKYLNIHACPIIMRHSLISQLF